MYKRQEWACNMRGDSPSIEDCDWSKVQIGEGNDLYTNRHIALSLIHIYVSGFPAGSRLALRYPVSGP